MMDNANNQQVFRQSRMRAIVTGSFGGGFCVYAGVTLLKLGRIHTAWIPFVVGLGVMLYAIHLWVSQVVVDEHGLVLRGLWTQKRIRWNEIVFWKAYRIEGLDSDEDFVHIERAWKQSPIRVYEFMVLHPGVDRFIESIRQHGSGAGLQESK